MFIFFTPNTIIFTFLPFLITISIIIIFHLIINIFITILFHNLLDLHSLFAFSIFISFPFPIMCFQYFCININFFQIQSLI